MKTLYFDVDGTVVVVDDDEPKRCLADGVLEDVIRQTGFQRLVCVGNFGIIANALQNMGKSYDELGTLFTLCRGVFSDEVWFRSVTSLVPDPERRAEFIDLKDDWWYVDDLAGQYLSAAGLENLLASEMRHRICTPDSRGDGRDVLDWLIEAK